MLYADDYAMPSKVAFDPEEPSLGRIRFDSVTPPHSPTSIKRCISRVENNPALAYWYTNLFVDTSTSLKEGHISLRTGGPGMSPNEPMAIVLTPPIPGPDGRYFIKNREASFFWYAVNHVIPLETVSFCFCSMAYAREYDRDYMQVNDHYRIIEVFRG
jgi:hypothetical protein